MKRIILAVLLAIIGIPLFAVSAWFSPFVAGFNVNLADSETYCGSIKGNVSNGRGTSKAFGAEGYTDQTMIALIGFTGASEKMYVDFKVTFDGDERWSYVSASEPYISRPFALDLVLCYKNRGTDNRTVYRLGHGGSDDDTVTIDMNNWTGNNWWDTKISEAWLDVVLVLPDANSVDLSSALSADDYHFTIEVAVRNASSTFKQEWEHRFSGYIGREPISDQASVFFSVEPNATASSISVSDLANGAQIQIGEYAYVTQAFMSDDNSSNSLRYENQINNMFNVFASSSEDPFSKGGEFTLMLNGVGIASETTSFKYEIGLEQNSSSSNINWYNGTMYVDEGANKRGNYNLLFSANKRDEKLGDNHGGRSLVFYDSGQIYIRAADANSLYNANLTAGVYTSTVYLHVISNF